MAITPTPVVSGTPVLDTAVRAELDRIEDWVNAGMVVGDIVAASVPATAVYRPETAGFPKENTECTAQRAGDSRFGQDGASRPPLLRPTALQPTFSGSAQLRDRQSVFLNYLGEDDAARMPHMSKREYLPGTSDVEVSASWRAVSAYKNTPPLPTTHPSKAGIFVIMYRKTTDATPTQLNGSIRRMNVQYYDTAPTAGSEQLFILGSDTFNSQEEILDLAPGHYDFWVEYQLDGGVTATEQVIIVEQSFVVEVHEQ